MTRVNISWARSDSSVLGRRRDFADCLRQDQCQAPAQALSSDIVHIFSNPQVQEALAVLADSVNVKRGGIQLGCDNGEFGVPDSS